MAVSRKKGENAGDRGDASGGSEGNVSLCIDSSVYGRGSVGRLRFPRTSVGGSDEFHWVIRGRRRLLRVTSLADRGCDLFRNTI
jgi:hypothetical protein